LAAGAATPEGNTSRTGEGFCPAVLAIRRL